MGERWQRAQAAACAGSEGPAGAAAVLAVSAGVDVPAALAAGGCGTWLSS